MPTFSKQAVSEQETTIPKVRGNENETDSVFPDNRGVVSAAG
jgi:hypothetical protein